MSGNQMEDAFLSRRVADYSTPLDPHARSDNGPEYQHSYGTASHSPGPSRRQPLSSSNTSYGDSSRGHESTRVNNRFEGHHIPTNIVSDIHDAAEVGSQFAPNAFPDDRKLCYLCNVLPTTAVSRKANRLHDPTIRLVGPSTTTMPVREDGETLEWTLIKRHCQRCGPYQFYRVHILSLDVETYKRGFPNLHSLSSFFIRVRTTFTNVFRASQQPRSHPPGVPMTNPASWRTDQRQRVRPVLPQGKGLEASLHNPNPQPYYPDPFATMTSQPPLHSRDPFSSGRTDTYPGFPVTSPMSDRPTPQHQSRSGHLPQQQQQQEDEPAQRAAVDQRPTSPSVRHNPRNMNHTAYKETRRLGACDHARGTHTTCICHAGNGTCEERYQRTHATSALEDDGLFSVLDEPFDSIIDWDGGESLSPAN